MDHLWHIWDRAPLLRYINPRSEWHHLAPPVSGVSVETTDGVFTNLSARPTAAVPETTLPSYNETLEDPVPPYWESQGHDTWGDEVYVDGLPVGSIISIIWTAMVASMFQFVGFVVTYLLHTSHASRAGSQIGLCVSLVNLGLAALPVAITSSTESLRVIPTDPAAIDSLTEIGSVSDPFSSSLGGSITHTEGNNRSETLVAYGLIIGGTFIGFRALWDFCRVKKLEWDARSASQEAQDV